MDVKKSIIIVIGILVVAAVVLAVAAVAYDLINGNMPDSTEPGPTATSAPTVSGATQSPGATATNTPSTAVSGPLYITATANQSSGMCLISILLNKDTPAIDASKLSMNIECDGITYRNVWTLKPSDWGYTDGDSQLEFNEVISPQVDTAALGIPQGRTVTIKILLDNAELQRTTVTPT
jgi:hypothetical protein